MGKLGLNVQPSTLAHHAFVAAGSALAMSVCVIHPWRPRAGTCLRADVRDDFRGEGFRRRVAGRRDLFGDLFAMAVQV
jgi:hypothetical protein